MSGAAKPASKSLPGRITPVWLTALALSPGAGAAGPAEGSPSAAYTTPAERREAGTSHRLTDWLTASALLESERQRQWTRGGSDEKRSTVAEQTTTAQWALLAFADGPVQAEWVLEYETGTDKPTLDEAVVTVADDDWEITVGRQYTPLGRYFSHFPTGPMLEFGETRAEGVALGLAASDRLELTLMRHAGRARPAGDSRWSLDWATGLEADVGSGWSVGTSYQSDLADALDGLPDVVRHRYRRRVPAAATFVRWRNQRFDASAEWLGALRPFAELAPALDRPSAWNLELAHFVDRRFFWAARIEGSDDLADAPRRRWGVSASWLPNRWLGISVEYLQGRILGEAPDDGETAPDARVRQIGIRLSLTP